MKTITLTVMLTASLFGKACIKDPGQRMPEKCGDISDAPEPSTFLLLGGALCVGAMLRRRK